MKADTAMATSSDTTGGSTPVRELVALFETREAFDAAVASLLASGFSRTDLSVLASHDSLDAAGRPAKPMDEALTAMVGELKYAFPLTTAGLIAIAAGPIMAPLAAVVAAGVGGAAVKEYLDAITDHPHTEEFAAALEASGIILWVRVDGDPAVEAKAARLLGDAGGRNIHPVVREA
ncbi:MAG TPA: hypothetical protein VEB64_11680 [Azospirillaceae bacterium]|nr:hypothetical protein [Azospirillaceae bacterium]